MKVLVKALDIEGHQIVGTAKGALLLAELSGNLTRTNLPLKYYFWMQIIICFKNAYVFERNYNTQSRMKIILDLEQI